MVTLSPRRTTVHKPLKPLKLGSMLWSIFMVCIGFFLHGLISGFQESSVSHTNDFLAATMAVEPSRNQPMAGKKHWCVVAAKYLPATTRGHFDHFPHAAEIVLPCWSFFMEQEATDNCGYYFASGTRAFQLSSWPKELIDTMGCEIKYGNGIEESGFVNDIPKDDVQYIPNLYLLRPRFNYIRYLNHPLHANALRRLFVSDDHILSTKGHGKPLQIGMIQRGASRRIDNFDQIKNAIQEAIPDGNIITTDFTFGTVREQAEWFATKDVIVAAHGAALTNSIFITQGTIVMQLYPPGYFWESLDPLIEQSGGYAIQWYQKGKNPMVESASLEKKELDLAGRADFSPPVDEVVRPLVYALGIERPTNVKLKKLYGAFV